MTVESPITFESNLNPVLGDFAISYLVTKSLSHNKNVFLEKCRQIMTRLVGDEFIRDQPSWMIESNGFQLEIDGWSSQYKIAIDYTGDYELDFPDQLRHVYGDFATYLNIVEYERYIRNAIFGYNQVLVIQLPEIIDDDILEDYLKIKLHELTNYRCFIALPRATNRQ